MIIIARKTTSYHSKLVSELKSTIDVGKKQVLVIISAFYSVCKGEEFTKLKNQDDRGWCLGKLNGRTGLYPATYAHEIWDPQAFHHYPYERIFCQILYKLRLKKANNKTNMRGRKTHFCKSIMLASFIFWTFNRLFKLTDFKGHLKCSFLIFFRILKFPSVKYSFC